MAYEREGTPPFTGNAADDLLAAYKAQQEGVSMRLELTAVGPNRREANFGCPPGHGAFFDWPEHAEVAEEVARYLERVRAAAV